MKSGVIRSAPREAPLLWVSVGDRTCGYFAGEVALHLEGDLAERRRRTAEALRTLAETFDAIAPSAKAENLPQERD